MQAFSSNPTWSPPTGTLGELTRQAHERAALVAGSIASLRVQAADRPAALPFAEALRGAQVRVIAEVKRASPSKGAIAPGLDAATQARQYARGGAAAISVLTEPLRFGGSLDDLRAVAECVNVPVIRKDFLVAPVQLWEARAAGASAALLIVRALSPDELPAMMAAAADAGVSVLVEVRNADELARALAVDATVIGVNNRDLETLVIDANTAPQLIPFIPSRCIAVAESGMLSTDDMMPAARAGADAVLIGSAISASHDPAAAVAALASVPRTPR